MRFPSGRGGVLVLSIAAFCTPAVGWTAGNQAQAVDRQKPAEVQAQAKPAADANLTKIDEFEIDLSKRLAGIQYKGSRPILEVMNPFTARKRSRIYGSLYEYHRNDNFDARNFFDPAGKELPEYKRNQFGGSLGFSVTKSLKLFGTYDGLRINKGSTILSHVPTGVMKRGDFSSLEDSLINPFTGKAFPNNQIPTSMIHPASAKMLATIPDPNRSDPDRNFVNNQPSIQNQDTATFRVDFAAGENSKIFGNYTIQRSGGFSVEPLPQFGLTSGGRDQNASIEYVRDINEQWVASIKAAFTREAQTELALQSGNKGLLASLGIGGVSTLDALDEGYPDFELSGYASLGSGDSPTATYLNEYSLEIGLGYAKKKHTVEFGAEILAGQVNNDRTGGMRRGSFEFAGDYTGDAFADFLLGIPVVAERGVGSDRADVRRASVRTFITDEWKINKKLTLTAALAYNHLPFTHSVRDNVYTFVPLLFEPPVSGQIVRVGSAEASRLGLDGLKSGQPVFPDRKQWEPEIGFAYSPQGNNLFVIRGSYHLFYEPRDMDETLDVLGRSYPSYYTERAESPEDQPALSLSNPFESAVPAELTIQGVEPHMKNMNIQEYQLYVQSEVFHTWNWELGYVGSKRTHSDRAIVANVPTPGPGSLQSRRPNPNFGRFSILGSGGSSSLNALAGRLRKRMAKGFSLEASYQWTKTLSSLGSSDPNNPRNLSAERAPGSDPQHVISLNYILDLPVGPGKALSTAWAGKLGRLLEGWRMSGITSIRSGSRFTPRLPGDANNDGVRGDRPDRLASGNLPSDQRSIDRWFATEAFGYPAPYAFGNCGRNILVGPGRQTWDISFVKRTQITREGNILELRLQAFNAFNHVNFSNPNTTFGTSVFGKIFGADRAREIEIAIKYTF
jgi:hypothetical protein